MHKPKTVMDMAEETATYNKARKAYLDNKGLINCSFCPYHELENESKKQRSWKKSRKTKYKIKK